MRVSGKSLSLTVPAQSVTLLVVPAAASGADTPGIYRSSSGAFFLRNANSSGPADFTFGYGPSNASWKPIKGDWDVNGTDTPGLYNPATGASSCAT